jgi:translation initiation factor 6
MEFAKRAFNSSPFVGIFSRLTEKALLVPMGAQKKEIRGLEELLGVEVLYASLANSPLLGVLCIANSNGIVVPELVEEREIKEIEEKGIKVKKVNDLSALGNLCAINDSKGICSMALAEKTVKEIERFLRIETKRMQLAATDVVGSAMVLANNGFIAHPKTTPKEMKEMERFLGLKGKQSTVNYGDAFVGNSAIANSKGAVLGLHTTPHEMLRISEAFE